MSFYLRGKYGRNKSDLHRIQRKVEEEKKKKSTHSNLGLGYIQPKGRLLSWQHISGFSSFQTNPICHFNYGQEISKKKKKKSTYQTTSLCTHTSLCCSLGKTANTPLS